MHSRITAIGLAVTLACAGGCTTLSQDYTRPVVELPASLGSGEAGAVASSRAGERWWTVYGDTTLDALVDEALANNADLALAAARVAEARAQAGVVDADLYPNVSARIGHDRTGSSLLGTFPLPPEVPRTQSRTRATLDMSYEIDFWGRYRRASEAERAALLAVEAARDSVRVGLVTQLVQQYFALLAADAQTATLERVVAGRSESVALLGKRQAAGVSSEFAVRQGEAEAESARVQLATTRQQRQRAETALAVLLGRSPRGVLEGAVARAHLAGLPAMAVQVPDGLPSELLLRRPDLREAEQRLVEANARIGVVRAAYFPSIGLTAYLGSESAAFAKLFTGPAGIFQFALAVTQPIFTGGRASFAAEAAEARREQALVRYRQAVAAAFADLRDALAAQTAANEILRAESARAEALRVAHAKADLRQQAGVASRLELLDIERNLLQAELGRIDAERARRAALADLFKALGGAWSPAASGAG